ncbi:HdeD family acid-resistance protein [Consotaella salsifontis]|uniref:Uncharacterized membrane protein HdeD, DUF308 family n=1 Tax=Consotaella salsifontis TaxID=1365950 RepID=A0A1T4T8J7_9HYPH|nr:DUF308 domain-containing protein [Consotaella salsifontis]SKA36756.1 Uncharacterized membrane protein HdeD, DUF308 family [Consotaella salsifontis]
MSSLNENKTLPGRLGRHLGEHRGFYVFQGVLLAIMGIIAIAAPLAATLASTVFFAWLLIIGGIAGMANAFRAKAAPGFWANILLAVLAVILGGIMLLDPLVGGITLTWLLAFFLLFSGAMNIAVAMAMRSYSARFWLILLSGGIDVVLALILLLGLPETAMWAVGLFLGLSFLSSGVGLILAALAAPSAD